MHTLRSLFALVIGYFYLAGGLQAATPVVALDFSSAGYGGGGVPLPAVPGVLAVSPGGDDDTQLIQGALDEVARRAPDAQGWRGAVVLRPGTYRVAGQLRITASGVVLRGNDAVIVATGNSRRTLIEIGGRDDRVVSDGIRVADEKVPAGATKLTLASVGGLMPGARVLVRRPSTAEWIAALGMNNFPGLGQYKETRVNWLPGTRDIEWERTITAVDATTRAITLDAPITTALEAKFGGATVHRFEWPGRIRQVGVEGLTCISETDPALPLEEEHAWMAVAVEHAEDVWARRVTARQFVSSGVWIGAGARAVTVEDCSTSAPVSEIGGWRRVSFYVGGQQVLVQRCLSEDGRRGFVVGHCAAGPNVFLECRAVRALADSGPFESWASGVLYDRVSIDGATIALTNLGMLAQGAGWAAANSVVWNSATADLLKLQDAPDAPNRAYVDAAVPSLYRSQLAARGGAAAERALAPGTLSRDPATVAVFSAPAAAPSAPRPMRPLSFENGYFVVGGRALFGGSQNSSLWRGQLVPGRPDLGMSPTRWAPGRTGPGYTEDLEELTDRMIVQQTPFTYAYQGLWYERRRDDHLIVRREDSEVSGPFFEMPWARSGTGRAWDGLSKYDLTRFNTWYFDRLRELAERCSAKGLVFVYQAYDNHNVQEAAAHWADFPWRTANNINAVGFPEPPPYENATQSRIHIADQFYDVTHPVRRDLHARYIRHTLDVLARHPNFVITLGYQFAGPLPFQQFFLDTVAAWGREHGRRVPLSLQTSKAVTDAILADSVRAAQVDVIDQRYWQYTADGKLFAPDGEGKLAFREIRNTTFGREATLTSSPELVYKQVREYRDRFPTKAIVASPSGAGPIPILMAGGASPVGGEGAFRPVGGPRNDGAITRFIQERLADVLPRLKPVDDVARDAWVLGDPATAWLFYSAEGPAITLNRALATNGLTALWFNPRDGTTVSANVGAGMSIAKPDANAWLLLLR